MKMLKMALVGIFGLVLFGVIAFYVDYYFYSWTSFVHPFGCNYKQIRVKSVPDKKNNILEQNYDLIKIGNLIESDAKYDKTYYNAGRVFASRKFDDIVYGIRIDYHNFSTENYFNVEFSNGNNTPQLGKTTPDYYIKRNINKMIDEMPLNDEQKSEIKNKVTVGCRNDNWFSF